MLSARWHQRFLDLAEHVSTWSKDPSTKVGCVLVNPLTGTVIATGYNGLPRGVVDAVYRMKLRPEKYEWTEHAERNAVYNAARNGHATEGAIAYLNWFPHPCCDCTRALIQAGIVEIVGPDRPFAGKGDGTYYSTGGTTVTMLAEAGIKVRVLP